MSTPADSNSTSYRLTDDEAHALLRGLDTAIESIEGDEEPEIQKEVDEIAAVATKIAIRLRKCGWSGLLIDRYAGRAK